MSSFTLARFCVQVRSLALYLSCLILITAAGMETSDSATPETCEELACENGNVCKSTRVNGTLSGQPTCICRGPWAGRKCEVRIQVTTRTVMSQHVALEIRGNTPSVHGKPQKMQDIRIAQLTVAVWNLNNSAQCLILQREDVEGSINLKELEKSQEYIVCVANGFVDSCSIFGDGVKSNSSSPNCIRFETRAFDPPPFDIGIVIVLCAVAVFVAIVGAFIYIFRHSLIMQLVLNIFCCRNWYFCRKHVRRRRQPMRKQREVSGEILISPDLSVDFEAPDGAQTATPSEPLCPKPKSSRTSSSGSRKSTYHSEPDGAVSITTFADHDDIFNDHSSLVPPISAYNIQHGLPPKYLANNCVRLPTNPSMPDHSYPLYLGRCPQLEATPSFPLHLPGNHISNITNSPSYEHLVKPSAVCGALDNTRFMKQQCLSYPCDGCQAHFCRPRSPLRYDQTQYTDSGVRLRNLTNATRSRQRPYSLPYTLMHSDLYRKRWEIANGPNGRPSRPHQVSLTDSSESLQAVSWSEPSSRHPRRDRHNRATLSGGSYRFNSLLCNPTLYELTSEQEIPEINHHTGYFSDYTYNTLPRSKKPKFVLPDDLYESPSNANSETLVTSQGPRVTIKSPSRPTHLNLPTINLPSEIRAQQPSHATVKRTASEPKQRVKNLISQFEHNLSIFRPARASRVTDDEEEFRDLQSPLAQEREKMSKRSRHTSFSKSLSRNTPTPSSESRHSFPTTNPIFGGHPSEHIIPPFSTNNDDDDGDKAHNDNGNDDVNGGEDEGNDLSCVSLMSSGADNVISCYDDDNTNLVTPFCTEGSSDDDTCHDVVSLASIDTLRDELVED